MIKLDGFLELLCNLDFILLFDVISFSTSRKDIGYTDKLLRIIGEAPLTLKIGRVDDTIISFIYSKSDIVILMFWYL